MWKVLLACLLVAVVLVSGCVQQPQDGDQPPSDGNVEASAYDQIEQEMEQAIEDIDLEGLEDELII